MSRAVGWGLVLASTIGACSAERVRPDLPAPALTASVIESRPPSAPTEERVDLESFAPLLAGPRFENVVRVLEAGDEAEAARAADAVLAAISAKSHGGSAGSDTEDPRPLTLLVARLKERAGDLERAGALYDSAAAPPEWTLSGYAALGAARVKVALKQPSEALKRLALVPSDGPIATLGEALRAEALLASGSREEAIASLRRAAASSDRTTADGAALRLAATLLDGSRSSTAATSDVVEALGLARRVSMAAAGLPARVEEARALESRALAALPDSERKALARPQRDEALAQLTALVDTRQFEAATAAAEQVAAGLSAAERWSTVGCETELQRARALSGLRDFRRAREQASEVARRCKGDQGARGLYLSGKYSENEKRWAEAVRFYESLEKDYPDHRLADDARFRAALSYEELGAEARFTDLISRMPDDYPSGDMVVDALFELSTRRLGKGDWAGAALILDRAMALPGATSIERGPEFVGRERYFRARAWGVEGDMARSLSEYEAIVEEAPLSYYMLQAYSRLRSADPVRAKNALERGLSRANDRPFEIPLRRELSLPGFRRALELLRISDVTDAERELEDLGLRGPNAPPELGWAVALLYARADSAWLSQRMLQGLPRDWLGRWPSGDFRKPWEIAFPRPYRDLVHRAADKNGIPEALVYAIMREESSFDPGAESPAHAYGLMQLIEPTAREFGRPLGLRGDRAALTRPAINVAIGCRVLAELSSRFAQNPLLAIPGYNAGPAASRRWLEARPDADFDVWVELIPYGETRRYTKRVLSSRAAYAFLYDREHAESVLTLPLRVSL